MPFPLRFMAYLATLIELIVLKIGWTQKQRLNKGLEITSFQYQVESTYFVCVFVCFFYK